MNDIARHALWRPSCPPGPIHFAALSAVFRQASWSGQDTGGWDDIAALIVIVLS